MTLRSKDPVVLETVFKRLQEAVANNERAPTKLQGVPPDVTRELALKGKIRIEVCGRNYRVVTILEGPLAGKSTARGEAANWEPYLIIGKNGTRRISA